jgi:glucan 1,4-alpha-glucosidase
MKYKKMKKLPLLFSLLFIFTSFGQIKVSSLSKKITLTFFIDKQGVANYSVTFKGNQVLQPSRLGIALAKDNLLEDLELVAVDSTTINETWKPLLGEVAQIKNNCKQLKVQLVEKNKLKRNFHIIFRVFDDGVGFRYEFPKQKDLNSFVVLNELTEFQLTGNHKTFWIPADYDTNEYPYSTTLLNEVDGDRVEKANSEIALRVIKDPSGVQTPLMMKTKDGLYINIHEAALENYPAMQLHVDKEKNSLLSRLVPDAVGNAAYLQTPCTTPWRTIIVSDKASEILESKMILNLNEAPKGDFSWVKPSKMLGIWWEMHVTKSTWDYAGTQDMGSWDNLANLKPTGKHGATTENTKKYIDFAAKHGFDGVLVEGWNTGWEDWFGKWKEEVFDFVTPYPDFNVKELQKYAQSKNVKIIMHHETSGSVTNYERRMDEAYKFMKENGYNSVKTGYVGRIIPRGEHHDGQWMINHYNRVAARTAKNKITVDMHEPVRPTGMHRTYPNWLASEAARGNEFNAWSKGNPPEHETILPFTRLMGGPMDYTPGIFEIKLEKYGKKDNFVHTTLAKQLALYVTMYSPLQMAADLPENYQAHLDAFQFIKDVALDWDDTKILEAEPGDYISIARKQKGKNNWFIGAITDENEREATLPLSFLSGKYVAKVYSDGKEAHWDKNPKSYSIRKYIVSPANVLKIKLASGGGCAISLEPATATNSKGVEEYK